jgi:ketosteroid isomerase-like protein
VNSEFATTTDDTEALTALNRRFIEAFRQGSWELLEPILSPDFSYLDGHTGEVWTHERYVEDLRAHPSSALAIDQVVVHIDGDTAVVSARTSREGGRHGRYVDTYARRESGWLCVHACVWPCPAERASRDA